MFDMVFSTKRLRAACDGRRHGDATEVAMHSEGSKRCTRCGEVQSLGSFSVARQNRDGRSSWCRSCYSAYNAARTAAKRVARLEANLRANRTCERCGDLLDPSFRADARFCSEVCVRASISARWYAANGAANNERLKLERLEAKRAIASHRTCEQCGVPIAPECRSDARFCSPEHSQRFFARRWAVENPERTREFNRRNWQRWYALRTDAFVEYVERLVVLERDDGVCGICRGDVDPFNFHVDHIIPLSRGGEHSYFNCQVAHPSCNIRKGNSMAGSHEFS